MTFLSFSVLASLSALAAPELPDHLQAIEGMGVQTLSQSADWRVRQQAAVIAAWQDNPDLAALAWTMQPRTTRAGHPRFHDPTLRDSGMAPVVLERLLVANEDENTRMALVDLLPRVGGPWAEELAAAYGDESQDGVRMLMVETARRAPSDAAVQLVLLGANDPATMVRSAAMRVAVSVEDGRPFSAVLLDGLLDGEPEVRAYAARGVGWMALDAALPTLHTLLTDSDADVRLQSLRAIHTIAPSSISSDVLDAMMLDADSRVVRQATQMQQPQEH